MISTEIWRRIAGHETRIRAYFSRRISSSDDVDDLVQESIARAAENLRAYRGEAPMLAWIYGICRNVLREYHRSFSKKRSLVERIALSDFNAPGDRTGATRETHCDLHKTIRIYGAEETEAKRVEKLAVEMAADRLDPSMRRLYDLYYRREMVIAEIAEDLDIPEGTVKYRLYRLRYLLKMFVANPDASARFAGPAT